MADKLIVKNFGPIRAAEMEIKKTTLLIGPQGSGKSTLAKLVAVCRDKDEWDINNSKNFPPNFYDYGIQNYIGNQSEFNYLGPVFEHHYKSGVTRRLQNSNELWTNNFNQNKVGEGLLLGIKTPVYIPAERFLISLISQSLWSFTNRQIPLTKSIIQFGAKFETARQKQNQLMLSSIKAQYVFENGKDTVIYNDAHLHLSESASGFQALVPMEVVIESFFETTPHTFIIEEPELNLFPTTQKNLIYYLADRCTKNDNELLMTTHSPYVLAALNNLLFAHKIASEKPHNAADVAQVIPRNSWLNPNDFAAYYVADGTVRSIINPKTGLISENELDDVSDLIGEEFNQLVDIYRLRKNETIA